MEVAVVSKVVYVLYLFVMYCFMRIKNIRLEKKKVRSTCKATVGELVSPRQVGIEWCAFGQDEAVWAPLLRRLLPSGYPMPAASLSESS